MPWALCVNSAKSALAAHHRPYLHLPKCSPARILSAMPTDLTQVIIFGASGDLTARKLVPALYAAFCQGLFPGRLQLVGVARRPWDDPVDPKVGVALYASDDALT